MARLTQYGSTPRIQINPEHNNGIYQGGCCVKTTIRVNRNRPESLTKQITDQLTGLIESGAMTVGSYLPSERELANSVKVARNVVRGSYENLMRAGRIQSEGRKGKTVKASGARRKAGASKARKK